MHSGNFGNKHRMPSLSIWSIVEGSDNLQLGTTVKIHRLVR